MQHTTKKLERTLSLKLANIYALLFFVPVIVIPGLIFHWMWPEISLFSGLKTMADNILWTLLSMLVLIVVHELLHGVTWQILSGAGKGTVEYRMKWKTLTPFTHIKEPIDLNAYRWGSAMPGLLTGILPLIVGVIVGSPVVVITGMYMTAAAGGDLMILWLLRKDKAPALVEDHPDLAGCTVLIEE